MLWLTCTSYRERWTIRKRYKYIGGIVLLLAVLAGGLFQYSTHTALVRAEALQFRRMITTQQDDGSYRFFFATNRQVVSPDASVDERFGNSRIVRTQTGSFP